MTFNRSWKFNIITRSIIKVSFRCLHPLHCVGCCGNMCQVFIVRLLRKRDQKWWLPTVHCVPTDFHWICDKFCWPDLATIHHFGRPTARKRFSLRQTRKMNSHQKWIQNVNTCWARQYQWADHFGMDDKMSLLNRYESYDRRTEYTTRNSFVKKANWTFHFSVNNCDISSFVAFSFLVLRLWLDANNMSSYFFGHEFLILEENSKQVECSRKLHIIWTKRWEQNQTVCEKIEWDVNYSDLVIVIPFFPPWQIVSENLLN